MQDHMIKKAAVVSTHTPRLAGVPAPTLFLYLATSWCDPGRAINQAGKQLTVTSLDYQHYDARPDDWAAAIVNQMHLQTRGGGAYSSRLCRRLVPVIVPVRLLRNGMARPSITSPTRQEPAKNLTFPWNMPFCSILSPIGWSAIYFPCRTGMGGK